MAYAENDGFVGHWVEGVPYVPWKGSWPLGGRTYLRDHGLVLGEGCEPVESYFEVGRRKGDVYLEGRRYNELPSDALEEGGVSDWQEEGRAFSEVSVVEPVPREYFSKPSQAVLELALNPGAVGLGFPFSLSWLEGRPRRTLSVYTWLGKGLAYKASVREEGRLVLRVESLATCVTKSGTLFLLDASKDPFEDVSEFEDQIRRLRLLKDHPVFFSLCGRGRTTSKFDKPVNDSSGSPVFVTASKWHLAVEDYGPGIRPEVLAGPLFVPSTPAPSSHSLENGEGLAIVSGGVVVRQEEDGRGCVISVGPRVPWSKEDVVPEDEEGLGTQVRASLLEAFEEGDTSGLEGALESFSSSSSNAKVVGDVLKSFREEKKDFLVTEKQHEVLRVFASVVLSEHYDPQAVERRVAGDHTKEFGKRVFRVANLASGVEAFGMASTLFVDNGLDLRYCPDAFPKLGLQVRRPRGGYPKGLPKSLAGVWEGLSGRILGLGSFFEAEGLAEVPKELWEKGKFSKAGWERVAFALISRLDSLRANNVMGGAKRRIRFGGNDLSRDPGGKLGKLRTEATIDSLAASGSTLVLCNDFHPDAVARRSGVPFEAALEVANTHEELASLCLASVGEYHPELGDWPEDPRTLRLIEGRGLDQDEDFLAAAGRWAGKDWTGGDWSDYDLAVSEVVPDVPLAVYFVREAFRNAPKGEVEFLLAPRGEEFVVCAKYSGRDELPGFCLPVAGGVEALVVDVTADGVNVVTTGKGRRRVRKEEGEGTVIVVLARRGGGRVRREIAKILPMTPGSSVTLGGVVLPSFSRPVAPGIFLTRGPSFFLKGGVPSRPLDVGRVSKDVRRASSTGILVEEGSDIDLAIFHKVLSLVLEDPDEWGWCFAGLDSLGRAEEYDAPFWPPPRSKKRPDSKDFLMGTSLGRKGNLGTIINEVVKRGSKAASEVAEGPVLEALRRWILTKDEAALPRKLPSPSEEAVSSFLATARSWFETFASLSQDVVGWRGRTAPEVEAIWKPQEPHKLAWYHKGKVLVNTASGLDSSDAFFSLAFPASVLPHEAEHARRRESHAARSHSDHVGPLWEGDKVVRRTFDEAANDILARAMSRGLKTKGPLKATSTTRSKRDGGVEVCK